MTLTQILLCVLLPPFAVINKGAGNFVLVLILTIFGWFPGVIAALIIVNGVNITAKKP